MPSLGGRQSLLQQSRGVLFNRVITGTKNEGKEQVNGNMGTIGTQIRSVGCLVVYFKVKEEPELT